MIRQAASLALALALVLASPPNTAHGTEEPKPGATDPRIRSIGYDPDQVVLLRGVMGYQLMVEFAPDERIENVSIGDALAWQVTPNKRANLLFLKPLDASATTNMTVVTDLRRYAFELAAQRGSGADMAYIVRFRYPQGAPEPASGAGEPGVRNSAYRIRGDRGASPLEVFDDGRFTYFRWPPDAAIPAIFTVGEDGAESVTNAAVRDDLVVVELLARRFVLRNGRQVVEVTNSAWRSAGARRDAP